MTRILYVGEACEVYVPALDGIVPHGVAVDIDDTIAASLLEQPTNWQPADGGLDELLSSFPESSDPVLDEE